MDSVGEGEGGKIWENGIETCLISCMKRVASPGLMHDILYFEWNFSPHSFIMGFPGGSAVKNLPAKQEPQEMCVQSLGQEDPLEEAIHSSNLA